MRFSQVYGLRIPKGNEKKVATKIRYKGEKLWSAILARYVSFGDSIAAGHEIDDNWEKNYGRESQYGSNGNNQTEIVPGSFTDIIRDDLTVRVGGMVNATSFAKSGDQVCDLMEKLDHTVVRNTLAKADYVTICIGANDVLTPALMNLERYIEAGESVLAEIAATIENNLATLADDSNPNSYTALFNKLYSINPNATYSFMTIYNPYRYLHLDEGKEGFFDPCFDSIPQLTILWVIEVDELIKEGLLDTPAVKTLFSRVNGLDVWAENYVTQLNTVLRNKITAFGKPNFKLIDAKATFDTYPDRDPINPGDTTITRYHHLVNVEYTRGYETNQMGWGRLWNSVGKTREQYWEDLIWKYVADGFNLNGFAEDLVRQIVEKVIKPDVDPHPTAKGHEVLKSLFESSFGW